MNFELITSLKVSREKFHIENWLGEDDIFALLEQGSFVFDDGSGFVKVSPLEAVNFKKGVKYNRLVVNPIILHLFRYKSEENVFGDESKIVYSDKERIKSTLNLLNKLDDNIFANDFQYRTSIFSDLVTLYNIEHQTPEKYSTGDTLADDLIKEIERNAHKKINLAQYANKHHFSYVQFARRFKQAVRMTPQDYLTGARMKKARYLLSSTELSIKEIANACGFSNEYYFSNFFKKYNNISPSAFRRNTINTL